VYEYVRNPGAWTTANAAAPTRSFLGVIGHLATISSFAENATITSLKGSGDIRAWIGLTDAAVNGTFTWITGEPFVFTNWSAGEPSNGVPPNSGGEDYVELFASGQWNDTSNGEIQNQGYVVEYDVSPFPPFLN
jgi:hypothetical protein